ncbi:RIP metalloprotease RseP, partial [Thioclava sp. BHET1]
SRVDKRGTRWQISALPFGGYVRFFGDSDAASGKDGEIVSGLSAEELRQTMHGAPLWARTLTVAAGPVFNFIFTIVIFCGLFMIAGVATNTPVIGSLKDLPASSHQLRPGDEITAVEGKATPDTTVFSDVISNLPPMKSVSYTINRHGTSMTVTGDYPTPPIVGSVQPQSAAYDAGLKQGDVIESVNGTPIYAFSQLRDLVGSSGGKPMKLTVWQKGAEREVTLTPKRVDLPMPDGSFDTRWLIGITGDLFFNPTTRTPGPVEALERSVSQTGYIIKTSLLGLYKMITGAISSCNLRGPIGIAETSGAAASQGATSFISFIAMLST